MFDITDLRIQEECFPQTYLHNCDFFDLEFYHGVKQLIRISLYFIIHILNFGAINWYEILETAPFPLVLKLQ